MLFLTKLGYHFRAWELPVVIFLSSIISFLPYVSRSNYQALQLVCFALATVIQMQVILTQNLKCWRDYTPVKSTFSGARIGPDILLALIVTIAYTRSTIGIFYHDPQMSTRLPGFEAYGLLVLGTSICRLSCIFIERGTSTELIAPLPAEAILAGSEKTPCQVIPSDRLKLGDIINVPPRTRIAADGVVVLGGSEVDESMVTGQKKAVAKGIDSKVFAGSMNGTGSIHVKVSGPPCQSLIGIVAELFNNVDKQKPKLQMLMERLSRWYTPIAMVLAIIIPCVYLSISSIKIKPVTRTEASQNMLQAAEIILLILSISGPYTFWLPGTIFGRFARRHAPLHGFIIRNPSIIAKASKISHVIFDKTGTLTQSELTVIREDYICPFNSVRPPKDKIQSMILGLVENSTHPVACGLKAFLQERGVLIALVSNIQNTNGKGMEGTKDGNRIRIGSPEWLGLENTTEVQTLMLRAYTVCCVMVDEDFVAAFGLTSKSRPEASQLIKTLRSRRITVSILSGDSQETVDWTALALGVNPWNVRAKFSATNKRDFVKGATKHDQVLYCGDGKSDHLAIKDASVGVFMNDKTVARYGDADVVLLRHDLSAILRLIDISRKTYGCMKACVAWALIFNSWAIGIAIADGGTSLLTKDPRWKNFITTRESAFVWVFGMMPMYISLIFLKFF